MFAGMRLLGNEFDLHKDGPRLLPILCPEPSLNPSREETRPQSRPGACSFNLEVAAMALLKFIDRSSRERFVSIAEVDSFASDTGRTVLHFGAALGFERFLQELVARGVDIDQPDNTGCTALHFAALFGHNNCTRLLLLEGADADIVNAEGDTALDIALESNHRAIVELLEAHMPVEADVSDSSDKQGDDKVGHHILRKSPPKSDDPHAAKSVPGSDANVAENTLT